MDQDLAALLDDLVSATTGEEVPSADNLSRAATTTSSTSSPRRPGSDAGGSAGA
ncbi:Uncharacterised protein [Mycobacteroides abscessus]|nr:Uncharacterised protein [Mycobacteroides abscessus]